MAGGKITRLTVQKSSTEVGGDFEGFYKKLSMSAGDNNGFKAKTTNHDEPKKEPKAGKYFVKGWWTNHKDEPIKRAIYGQQLRFHIEMDKTYAKPGDVIYFAMFDSDMRSFGNDVIKADDPIPLIHSTTKRSYTWEKVNNENKVIIHFSTDDTLERWTQWLDQDKIFELYFRCSYVNKGATEHVELPYNFHDYLQLGTLVIDRFKMPGLNPAGDGIAEDMAYGTGHPYKKPIYNNEDLALYKKEYATFGFNNTLHANFANIEPKVIELEEIVVTAKAKPKPKPTDLFETLPTQMPVDNTSVFIPEQPSFEEIEEAKRKLNQKNEKAIYSRKEIEGLGKLMNLTSQSNSESALWFDFRAMTQGLLSRGKLNDNISLMISKMKRNEGGIFENKDLTDAILENPATINYLQLVEDYMAEQLKTSFSKLEEVEDSDPYFEKEENVFTNSKGDRSKKGKGFSKPAYTWKKDWNVLRGETIALNDIWATEVLLKEAKFNGDDYTAKYQVTLWDHFGLNSPDMEKFYSYGAGFRAWFVLQHLWGYKAFITKMTFNQEFKGNLNKGKAEINAERQRIKEAAQQEDREKAERVREIMKGPKY